jgi:hypothetical protein
VRRSIVFWVLVALALPVVGLDATSWAVFDLPESNFGGANQGLRSAGVDFLDSATATVPVGEFVGFDNVPVADLKVRLLPQDPRWDPYLHQAASFFGSPDRPKIYVAVAQTAQARRILEPLGGVLLTSGGTSPVSGVGFLFAVAFFLLAGLIQILSLSGRRLRVTGLVFWILGGTGGFLGGGPDVFWALWAWWVTQHFVSRRFASVPRSDSLGFFSVLAGGSVLGEGLFRGLLGQNFVFSGLELAFAWAAFWGGLRAFEAWRAWRQSLSEHAWFQAVPLKRVQVLPFLKKMGAGLSVLVGTLLLLLGAGPKDEVLQGGAAQAELFWQHCWYQEAVAFGLKWQDYPQPAVLKDFVREGTQIVEKDRVEMRPDEAWKIHLIKDRPATDLSRLWIKTP